MTTGIYGLDLTDRRKDRRIDVPPIDVRLEKQNYRTSNWGLGGLLLAPYRGGLKVHETISVDILATVGKTVYRHTVSCRVARRSPSKSEIALRFVELPAEAFETLEGLLTGRLRRQQLRSGA